MYGFLEFVVDIVFFLCGGTYLAYHAVEEIRAASAHRRAISADLEERRDSLLERRRLDLDAYREHRGQVAAREKSRAKRFKEMRRRLREQGWTLSVKDGGDQVIHAHSMPGETIQLTLRYDDTLSLWRTVVEAPDHAHLPTYIIAADRDGTIADLEALWAEFQSARKDPEPPFIPPPAPPKSRRKASA